MHNVWRDRTNGQKLLIVVAFLVVLTLVMLFLSTGGHDTSARAAARAKGLPHCTKKHRCTKKQAHRVLRYAAHSHDSKARTLRQRRPPTKVRAKASSCRTWHPRIKRIARAGEIFWRGGAAHWCFNWHRVTRAWITGDADVTTLGRFLGFDHITQDPPTQGYYTFNRHGNGGYLMEQKFTFEQCIPVIQIGPLCDDRRAWLKVFLHYDGSGYASGKAP
jgi:hypothetical protein